MKKLNAVLIDKTLYYMEPVPKWVKSSYEYENVVKCREVKENFFRDKMIVLVDSPQDVFVFNSDQVKFRHYIIK